MNKTGPGEVEFIRCDVTRQDEVRVYLICQDLTFVGHTAKPAIQQVGLQDRGKLHIAFCSGLRNGRSISGSASRATERR